MQEQLSPRGPSNRKTHAEIRAEKDEAAKLLREQKKEQIKKRLEQQRNEE